MPATHNLIGMSNLDLQLEKTWITREKEHVGTNIQIFSESLNIYKIIDKYKQNGKLNEW